MPGKKTNIPSTIERSDTKAKRTWKKAHDSAVDTYGEGRRAHMVAYSALKHTHKKVKNRWVPKDGKGPSDPQAARSVKSKPKSTSKNKAPTARGKVAKTKKAAKKKAKQSSREYQRERRAKKKK